MVIACFFNDDCDGGDCCPAFANVTMLFMLGDGGVGYDRACDWVKAE